MSFQEAHQRLARPVPVPQAPDPRVLDRQHALAALVRHVLVVALSLSVAPAVVLHATTMSPTALTAANAAIAIHAATARNVPIIAISPIAPHAANVNAPRSPPVAAVRNARARPNHTLLHSSTQNRKSL